MKLDKTTTANNRKTDNTNRKSLGEALCDLDDLICEVNKSKCIQEIKRISLIFDDENDVVCKSKKMFTQLNQNNRKEKEEHKIADKNQKNVKKISASRDIDINRMNDNKNNNIKTLKKLSIHEKGKSNSVSALKTQISPNRVELMSNEHEDTIISCERMNSVENGREHWKNNDRFNTSENEFSYMSESGKYDCYVENNKIQDQKCNFKTDNRSKYGNGDLFSVDTDKTKDNSKYKVVNMKSSNNYDALEEEDADNRENQPIYNYGNGDYIIDNNTDKTNDNFDYEVMNRKDSCNYDVRYDLEDEDEDNCQNQPVYRCLSRNSYKELDKSKHLTKASSFLDDLDGLDDLIQEVNKNKNDTDNVSNQNGVDKENKNEYLATKRSLEKQKSLIESLPDSTQPLYKVNETKKLVLDQCLNEQFSSRENSPRSIEPPQNDSIDNESNYPHKSVTEIDSSSDFITDQALQTNKSPYEIENADSTKGNEILIFPTDGYENKRNNKRESTLENSDMLVDDCHELTKIDDPFSDELINKRENTFANSNMFDENFHELNEIYDPMPKRLIEIDNMHEKPHFSNKRENTINSLDILNDDSLKSHEINESIMSEKEEQINNIEKEKNTLSNKRPSRKFKRNISTEELEDLFGGEEEEKENENENEIINDNSKISNHDYESAISDDDVSKKNKRGGCIEPNINLMLLYERMVSDLNLENCELRRENLKTSSALKRRIEGLQSDIIMLRSDLMLKNDFIKHLLNTVKCE